MRRLIFLFLFTFASFFSNSVYAAGWIPPLPVHVTPDATYLKYYHADGRPREGNPFIDEIRKRFGARLNLSIPMGSMSEYEQRKWTRIYDALAQTLDRTQSAPRSGLFIDSGSANEDVSLAGTYSLEFEDSGMIHTYGAWNVAIQGTARRHHFASTPCAEFQSEIIRQSYEKSGYRPEDDFTGSNYLIWTNTAAVTNLARALYDAGWIPWDPAEFQPKTGAIAMHEAAQTPGHAFAIAGENGRFIVDNTSPEGRDLYTVSSSSDMIDYMYHAGVFFLPPGIVPEQWPEQWPDQE